MMYHPDQDPNDENNYVEETQNTSEEMDNIAIDNFEDFFNDYGNLPEWVKSHPEYIKRNKRNG